MEHFDSLWACDHFYGFQRPTDPFLEGWTTLTWLAAKFPKVQLGHHVLGLGYRNPALTAKMAATLEELTVGKGHDPREFSLLVYGGGGSLVGSALASRLSIPRVVVPVSPGTFSAWGMLTLDVVHDFARTSLSALDALEPEEFRRSFLELEQQATVSLERERIPEAKRSVLRSIDMRYEGQEHTLTLPVEPAFLDNVDLVALREIFDQEHTVVYGYSMADPVEVTGYRIRAVGALDKPRRPTLPLGSESADQARKGTRRALHGESGGEFEWTIYDRTLLQHGNRLRGPAIVEEPAATTLIGPNQELEVDNLGNLVITLTGEES
jgi:N-methylhydantoinase A